MRSVVKGSADGLDKRLESRTVEVVVHAAHTAEQEGGKGVWGSVLRERTMSVAPLLQRQPSRNDTIPQFNTLLRSQLSFSALDAVGLRIIVSTVATRRTAVLDLLPVPDSGTGAFSSTCPDVHRLAFGLHLPAHLLLPSLLHTSAERVDARSPALALDGARAQLGEMASRV